MTEPTESKPVPAEELTIIVEWPNRPGGVQKASLGSDAWRKMQQEVDVAINRAMGTIRAMAYRISNTIETIEDKVRPDEAEIEFGVNLDTEAGAILAKTSAGAQLTVKLKWTIEHPQRARILVNE